MDEFMQWYWDWGTFAVGIISLGSGILIGWVLHKEKVSKELLAEEFVGSMESVKK